MKKNLFLMASVALAALTLTACGSDDDAAEGNIDTPVTLVTPSHAGDAVSFSFKQAVEPVANAQSDFANFSLSSITFTESGKAVVELENTVDKTPAYFVEPATKSNNVYTISGSRVRGTVTVLSQQTRMVVADNGTELKLELFVTNDEGKTVEYTTGENSVGVTTSTGTLGDETYDNLCRTWSIDGVILDLKSKKKNIKAYEEFDSNANGYFDLRQVRQEAEQQELRLTEEEKADFERTVKQVTITKSGLFIIEYTDHEPDVAQWSWVDENQRTEFTLTLNGEDMGNKFVTDGSTVTFAFNGNRCNLKLDTKLNDSENSDWEVQLTLKLHE